MQAVIDPVEDHNPVDDFTEITEITEMPGHLLRRCQQIATSIFLKQCRTLDLTPLQYAALSAVDHCGELDQNRLGGLTAMDRTTIGTVISNLEARGWVVRRRSQTDRRFNIITCSPAGRKLLTRARPAVDAAQLQILAPLGQSDQRRFMRYLKQIVDGNNEESRAPLRK